MLRPEFVQRKLHLIVDDLHLPGDLPPAGDHGILEPDFADAIASSAGLRNILVHEYNGIDHTILHASIATALEQYREYVESVGRFLAGR